MAKELGAVVPDQFFQWMAGAALPAIAGLFLTPLLLYKVRSAALEADALIDRASL